MKEYFTFFILSKKSNETTNTNNALVHLLIHSQPVCGTQCQTNYFPLHFLLLNIYSNWKLKFESWELVFGKHYSNLKDFMGTIFKCRFDVYGSGVGSTQNTL